MPEDLWNGVVMGENAWRANPSYTPEMTVSHQTHLSKTPFLLAPHSKFQLLLHCWHLSPRAQEVSTRLLVQSRWRCALLDQALTRSNLYLSLIPPAGIAVMPAIVFAALSSSTIHRIGPKQGLICCQPLLPQEMGIPGRHMFCPETEKF